METQAQGSGPQRSLVRKLAEVMGEVERIPKSGRNEFHRYDYATEADIVAAVRKAMAQRALMLVPTVERVEWKAVPRKQGGEDRLATLTVRFTLMDGDSGEEVSFQVLGEGQDAGDKATYKALTGATKYALLKLFLIPTGDDPEQDERPAQRGGGQGQQQRPPQQRAPSPAPAEGKREAPRQAAAKEAAPLPAEQQAAVDKVKGALGTGEPHIFDRLWAAMQEAQSSDALVAAGNRIAEAHKAGTLSDEDRTTLRKQYAKRQGELVGRTAGAH